MKQTVEEKTYVKGILTVELAYLMPILFSVFVLIIHTTFYYHDKNILFGAASETAVVWAQIKRMPGKEESVNPEEIYQERIRGKTLLFSNTSVSMSENKEYVSVTANARNGMFSIEVCAKASIVNPEEKIRRKRILENLIEEEG